MVVDDPVVDNSQINEKQIYDHVSSYIDTTTTDLTTSQATTNIEQVLTKEFEDTDETLTATDLLGLHSIYIFSIFLNFIYLF